MHTVKVTTVGNSEISSKEMRNELELHCKKMAMHGWKLDAMVSRGGTVYCVFTRESDRRRVHG